MGTFLSCLHFGTQRLKNSGCYATENEYIARRGFKKQKWSAADVQHVFQKCLTEVAKAPKFQNSV